MVHRAKCKQNKNRMKQLDILSQRLRQKNTAKAYINIAGETMVEYYHVFGKWIKSLPPEAQLSDFYHLSEKQKNDALLFVIVGTDLAIYSLYKCLK